MTDAEINALIMANNQKMRAFIAEQCNAMMDYAKAQGAVFVTQEQMAAFVTEAMKPWALVLDRIGTALDNHGERLTALEQVPHFNKPNGGR